MLKKTALLVFYGFPNDGTNKSENNVQDLDHDDDIGGSGVDGTNQG